MWQAAFNRYPRFIKRYKKSEDGSAAIEFAMVAAPFFYLLMAIFETSMMLFSEYVISNGTAQASRMIRTGQVYSANFDKAAFKAEVCGRLAAYLDCANHLYIDVRSYPNFDSVTTSSAIDGNGDLDPSVTTASTYDPGVALDVVVVRVYYDWELFTPGIGQLANLANGRRVLSAGAAFRNEPFGS